jgi:acyl-CoA thioesterase YciA
VDVEVFAERRRAGKKQVVRVTEAQLTYVAMDEARRPRPVPGGTVEA